MLLLTDLNDDIPSFNQPCGLTIGSFDGVHLGHKALLQHLRSKLPPDGILAVFTFFNHPSHLFSPHTPTSLICPPLQKIKHLADYGVEIVYLIPFSAEFAKTSFETFLTLMKQRLHFSQLALGSGASFGKNKEGDQKNVQHLADKLQFEVDYMEKFLVNGKPVSSGHIRTLISHGNFLEIKECLGHPYSLMGRIQEENGHYRLEFPGICLPPTGDYPIRLKTHSHAYQVTAHVVQKNHQVLLKIPPTRLPFAGEDAECVFMPS